MNKEYTGLIFGAGVLAIGFGIYEAIQAAKIVKKLNTSLDELSEATIPDIKEEMIQAAVNLAVDREVNKQVKIASDTAVQAVKNDISRQVKDAVDSAYDKVEDDVKLKLEQQVGDVNIDKVRKEVIERAKNRAAEKFEDDLNDILQKYNDNLENVQKIYGGIAKTISGTIAPDVQSLRRALMYG